MFPDTLETARLAPALRRRRGRARDLRRLCSGRGGHPLRRLAPASNDRRHGGLSRVLLGDAARRGTRLRARRSRRRASAGLPPPAVSGAAPHRMRLCPGAAILGARADDGGVARRGRLGPRRAGGCSGSAPSATSTTRPRRGSWRRPDSCAKACSGVGWCIPTCRTSRATASSTAWRGDGFAGSTQESQSTLLCPGRMKKAARRRPSRNLRSADRDQRE